MTEDHRRLSDRCSQALRFCVLYPPWAYSPKSGPAEMTLASSCRSAGAIDRSAPRQSQPVRVLRRTSSPPIGPVRIDAARRPTFAASSAPVPSKARAAMNRDMVKLMPPNQAHPCNAVQLTPSGREARRSRTAARDAPTIPTGLPTASPRMTAAATLDPDGSGQRDAGVCECKKGHDHEGRKAMKHALESKQRRRDRLARPFEFDNRIPLATAAQGTPVARFGAIERLIALRASVENSVGLSRVRVGMVRR